MSIWEAERRILSSDVDMHRRLRLSVLFTWLQEAAIAHTEALGMGRDKTLDRGILWVVTLQRATIERLPEYDEQVVLRSWPGHTMHVLFPRYFALETTAGEPLVRASSLWTLTDLRTRKLVFPERCGVVINGTETGEEIPLPSAPRPLPCTETRPFTVPYSYVDLNGHMNNTRYLDLAEDILPAAAEGRALRSVATEYSRELSFGETFDVRWGAEGGSYYITAGEDKPWFRLRLEYD